MSHSFLSRLFAAVAFAAVTLAHAAEPPVPNLFEAIGNLLKPDEPTAEPAVPTAPDPATRAVAAPSAQRSRVALVIGNADYKSGPLANPVNDAQAMAARLRGLGFDVVLRENLKTREIGSVYREFRSKIAPGGAALVFYAGHGVQFKGENYFPAIDAEIHGEEDVPLQSLNLNTLLSNMEEAKAGVSLVFLDACRDNPFARRFRSGSRGLAKVEAASGTLIHYATRPGSVASDGDGRNGTYTEALLAQMNEPGVPVEMMLKRVANRVVEKTGGKQEPWVEGSLRGEFYFIFQGPATVNVQQAPADPEAETWQAAERANTEGAYRAYLDAYPAGRYATAAKIAIDTFKKPEPPPVPDDPEAALWVEVKQSGAKEYYEAYLKQYTKGKYAALAKVELKKIEAREKAERAKEEAERKAALAREEAEKKAAAERERQAQVQAEKEAWERAKGDNTVLAYAGYLESWPKGRFAALAEAGKQKAQREAAEREKQEAAQREREAREAEQRQRAEAERQRLAAERERQEAERAAKEMRPGKVFRDCPDCPEMVVIPAGNFEMGGTEFGDEKPVHTVRISKPFSLAKTEVTQGQWRSIMGNNPSHFSSCGDDCPVDKVNWNEAQEYVRKLSQKAGKTYRLPSEAEWEYACRAGGTYTYCGSDSVDSVAWYTSNSGGKTYSVAGKQANGWGLYDMSGNVWEWTEDCWDGSYSGAPSDGSAWTNGQCDRRVVRGGSWYSGPQDVRSAVRVRGDTAYRSLDFGFRPARMLP